jgi:hypothetical protein
MSISGSTPAHAYFGVPVSGIRPSGAVAGSRIAAASGPFIGRGNKCTANEDTCMGNRVSNQELCAGHMKSAAKASKANKVEFDGPIPSDGSVVVHAELGTVDNGV